MPPASNELLGRAEAIVRERGHALTPLRRQVLDLVMAAQRPLGAYDLLAALQTQRGTRVPPTTVYRVLDFLVEHGLIHRIESKNAYFACCVAGAPHQGQFLLCEQCGHAVEIPGDDLAKKLVSQPLAHGFEMHRQVVELSGFCSDCLTHPHK